MQSSFDTHPHIDELSSVASAPSELKSHRQRKLPPHLQDFHCYNSNSITPNTSPPPLKTSPYPLTSYISYACLYEPFRAFINIITNTNMPQKYSEARLEKIWNDAMELEIGALIRIKTYSITILPPGQVAVSCKWVYTIKHLSDGNI